MCENSHARARITTTRMPRSAHWIQTSGRPNSAERLREICIGQLSAITLIIMADESKEALPPASKWAPVVAFAWLIPGGGHFLLKRPARGGLLLASVAAMFLLGL